MLRQQQAQMNKLTQHLDWFISQKSDPPVVTSRQNTPRRCLHCNRVVHIARFCRSPWPVDSNSRSPQVDVNETSAGELDSIVPPAILSQIAEAATDTYVPYCLTASCG